jgi:hypothetical protein
MRWPSQAVRVDGRTAGRAAGRTKVTAAAARPSRPGRCLGCRRAKRDRSERTPIPASTAEQASVFEVQSIADPVLIMENGAKVPVGKSAR